MKELGVGIIGFGFIGKVHAFGYRNMPCFYDPPPARIRMVGVCTSREETADRAREVGGFDFGTTRIDGLLDRDDIDIVNICTPNHLHRDELLAAMAAGKHIYCDKPLTATLAEAKEIAAALQGYQGINQMTFNNRFTLVAMKARQLIDEGFVGKVTQFRAGYFHAGSVNPAKAMGWKQQSEAGGGVINDLASHVVDAVNWLIGPIVEVAAQTRILYETRPDKTGEAVPVEAEDAVNILARIADGGIGVIEATKIATGAEDELRVEIHGDRGAVRFNTMQPNFLEAYSIDAPDQPMGGTRGWTRIDTVHRYPKPAGWPGPKFAVGWLRSHIHCLYHFVRAVAEGRPAEPSLRDGYALQALLEDIRKSAEHRTWVTVGADR